MKADLRKRYLGWTILQRSCELAAMARELGDKDLADHLKTVAQRAGAAVGASRTLIARIGHDFSHARRRRAK
jgi:electron transfer flavoprotein alpha subunit